MCGRTACTLSKEHIQMACGFRRNAKDKYKELKWEDVSNGGKIYKPSYNVCPTDVTPVIRMNSSGERVLQPMVWSMIPPWHRGMYNNHGLSTNNCRIESILTSKLYKPSLLRGQRCVVVCDGFYEWQTTKKTSSKPPYFVYAPQSDHIEIDSPDDWPLEFSPDAGWTGPRLLFIAAIFNNWSSPQGEEYASYSIVTMESDNVFSWLHHRVPAILGSEEEVAAWLNPNLTAADEAIKLLKCAQSLKWHPVSTDVNKSTNKRIGLNKAVDINAISKSGQLSKSANLMTSWLSGAKSKRGNTDDDSEEPSKKSKTE